MPPIRHARSFAPTMDIRRCTACRCSRSTNCSRHRNRARASCRRRRRMRGRCSPRGSGHGHRQAREPHADRLVQGARRTGLCGRPVPCRCRSRRARHRDPRQSRPVDRAGRGAPRHSGRRSSSPKAIPPRRTPPWGVRRRIGRRPARIRRKPTVAEKIQNERGYHYVPSFHRDLVRGVATYALELFQASTISTWSMCRSAWGPGICGLITVRDLLGLQTEIVGVVAENAPAFALSFAAGRPVPANSRAHLRRRRRVPRPPGRSVRDVRSGAARVVPVSEDEIAEAIRIYYAATHNLAEGAGAAPSRRCSRKRPRHEPTR